MDPRTRILAAAGFITITVMLQTLSVLSIALLLALALIVLQGMLRESMRRILPLNIMLLLLFPFVTIRVSVWTMAISETGLLLFAALFLRANAIMIITIAMIGTIDMSTLGHALIHLRVPAKLAHLFLFTFRYIEVVRCENARIQRAARLRGFKPKVDLRTYRTYASMIGHLILRGLNRSERILNAMKCRGYKGRFFLLRHFSYSKSDLVYGLMFTAAGFMLTCMDFFLRQ